MKFSRPKVAGSRLKQNYIKLRETKLGQYNITLPKGIVEALNFSKGNVFRIYIENGNIVLRKDFVAANKSNDEKNKIEESSDEK